MLILNNEKSYFLMDNRLTLGKTTVGDLLLKNTISATENNENIKEITLEIPEYQRPYKWTARNAGQLYEDIFDAYTNNKEVYRVGTLILHHDGDKYDIVDGQQRVITFSLLLDCFGCIDIDFLNQCLSDNPFNVQNIINNHRLLKRKIDRLVDDRVVENIKDYICDRCEFIIVITEDLSEAFQFFDSQNARGKALYPHDLLKAYHLREMSEISADETEKVVKDWEDINQKDLANLFNEYLYYIKEWIHGNRANKLSEANIGIFKGVNSEDNYPYAQYYKGAYSYASDINNSFMPFVLGIQHIRPFQLNAPIIAGKPFFEYTKYYFDILSDIQNNDKYEGYYIKDNEIVKTLDLKENRKNKGDRICRKMFDTALLLFVDRFCPDKPSKIDTEYFEQFVIYAFIWAYSLRVQYSKFGWFVAQNYILGESKKSGIVNGFNLYKEISLADSPMSLMNKLSDLIVPIDDSSIKYKKMDTDKVVDGIYQNYLKLFEKHGFWEK